MKNFPLSKISALLAAFLLASCGPSAVSNSGEASSFVSLEETVSSISTEEVESIQSQASSEEIPDTSEEIETSSTAFVTSEEEKSEKISNEESLDETSSSQAVSSEDPNAYHWNIDLNLYGLEFQSALGSLMNATRTKTISYSQCLAEGAKAAAYPNENSSTFIPFYHAPEDSEKTTTSSCNREHTWPKSRGGNSIEKDPIVIRPTLTSDNSDRQNYFYGNQLGNEWDPASCGYEGARGESARVILYAVTCYHDSYSLNLSNNPSDATSAKTMGTLKTLLEWNRTYKPTEFEKTVNERYAALGHARNAFVDHPEYADYIYDSNGYRASVYQGGTLGGAVGSEEETRTYYEQHTDLSSLDDKDFIIASPTSSSGTGFVTMTSSAKSETLPWYLVGNVASVEDDRLYETVPPESFHFSLCQGNAYEITASNGKYLYGYVAGTHYSIGMASGVAEIQAAQGSTTVSNSSREWTVTDLGNGEFSLHTSSVYLEYYSGSWCGYKSAPNLRLRLFNPAARTETA